MADEVLQRLKREAMRQGEARKLVLDLLDPDGDDNLLAALRPPDLALLRLRIDFVQATAGAERWKLDEVRPDTKGRDRLIRLRARLVGTNDLREHVLRRREDDRALVRIEAIMQAAELPLYAWSGEELFVQRWANSSAILRSDDPISFCPGTFRVFEKLPPAHRAAILSEAAAARRTTSAPPPSEVRRPRCAEPGCTSGTMGPGARHCALHSSADVEDE